MVDELARLGLSVNYRCVMYMEKKVGLSEIQQFTEEGGSFYVWTSSETIHQITNIFLQQPLQNIFQCTDISLFQAHTTMDDGQKRDMPMVPSGHGKITLPVKYTTVSR